MNTRIFNLVLVVLMLAVLIGYPASAVKAAEPQAVTGAASLSAAEIEGLLFMREEEKLAHDVYVVMYQKWRLGVFSNISSSETNHMAAVKNLLDRYGLPDPASPKLGVFNNPELQALYNELIARGMKSQVEALKVGGLIEEVDIVDLEYYIARTTHTDIRSVYNNLLDASCNHLRAFVSNLQRRGVVYVPQVLSPEVYQAILNGTY